MLTTQVTLTDQQTLALRSIAQRTGKTEKGIIVEAVEQFIAQYTPIDRQAALQQARGMWQDRTDLPDLRTLREESNRYISLDFWDNPLDDEDWNNA